MREYARLCAIASPLLLGLTIGFPVYESAEPGFAMLSSNVLQAADRSMATWLLRPGTAISVLMAIQSLTGWHPRVWGWIGLVGSACLFTGSVGVVTAEWPHIMYDHIIDGELVPHGPVQAEPSWGLLLVLAATVSLAVASILQLVSGRRRTLPLLQR